MASLTETAKAVLEGKSLQEGAALPSVGPISGGVSNPNPVDSSTASTANAKTLKPKSKSSEADPKHNEAKDLGGQTPTSLPSGNLGAAAAGSDTKGESRDSHEFVLKASTQYAFVITNTTADTNTHNLILDWYEH
jgi:hypothetical protein